MEKMPAPEPVVKIAEDVLAGRPRRAKVRTLMGYFNLKRRREAGLYAIRQELIELGISTVPDFETADFDDQVRFVVIGQEGTSQPDEPASVSAAYALEVVATGRFRALLTTFDAYERFVTRLVSDRLAKVHQHGQNPRRQDRDRFPFFAVIEVDGIEADQVEGWLDEASRLGASESVPVELPVVTVPEVDSRLREHISDLHEAMRAELSRQVSELRDAMERKVDEVRLEAIRQLAKELNDEEALKVIQEFDQEMRQKLERKDNELKDAFSEISLLSAQVADLEEQLAEQDNYDPGDAYPTMSATVQLFADICKDDPLVVNDSALKSAQKSASQRRREVFKFLLFLREYAIALYGPNPSNPRPDDWFAKRGYDYAQGDSESTRNKHGRERIVDVDGKMVQLEEHVTLFENSPNCISVYWLRDDAKKRILVGYVGQHLTTVSR